MKRLLYAPSPTLLTLHGQPAGLGALFHPENLQRVAGTDSWVLSMTPRSSDRISENHQISTCLAHDILFFFFFFLKAGKNVSKVRGERTQQNKLRIRKQGRHLKRRPLASLIPQQSQAQQWRLRQRLQAVCLPRGASPQTKSSGQTLREDTEHNAHARPHSRY